jgi:hypothetical protein
MQPLLEASVLDAGPSEAKGIEEVGEAGEGDEAGVVCEGGDPGEKGPVGAVGCGDIRLGGREIDGQVGVGARWASRTTVVNGLLWYGKPQKTRALAARRRVLGSSGGSTRAGRESTPAERLPSWAIDRARALEASGSDPSLTLWSQCSGLGFRVLGGAKLRLVGVEGAMG